MAKKKTLIHYIGMNGTSGCMPDSCNAYETKRAAVESLTDLLELTTRQARELSRDGLVYCKPGQGADYAEVSECTCSEPWVHSEGSRPEDWPDYPQPEPEPDEDSITTGDHRKFYQYGKLAFELTEGENVNQGIERELNKMQFWPNVFFISDHGNAHLIHYWEDK